MIKFHLYKLEKRLIFQIIEQDPDLRGALNNYHQDEVVNQLTGETAFCFVKEGKSVFIQAEAEPHINFSVRGRSIRSVNIFLRGYSTECNEKVVSKKLRDNKQRDELYDLILGAFKDWKSNF